eukprot:4039660-Pleurochrysis_carterae.AAC.1
MLAEARTRLTFVGCRMRPEAAVFLTVEMARRFLRDSIPTNASPIDIAKALSLEKIAKLRMFHVHFERVAHLRKHDPFFLRRPSSVDSSPQTKSTRRRPLHRDRRRAAASSSTSSANDTMIIAHRPSAHSKLRGQHELLLATPTLIRCLVDQQDIAAHIAASHPHLPQRLLITSTDIRALFMDDAIREMHQHERRFSTLLPQDHLYVEIFRRFMNIDDDDAEPLVIEDMRLLKDTPALASKLTNIRVMGPFDASIKCTG